MAKTVFDAGMITDWEAALDRRPKAVTEAEWPALPQIVAFAPVALNAGMALRTRSRDGAEFSFVINPVAARHLASCILRMGFEAGWLDARGHVVCPPMPDLDS